MRRILRPLGAAAAAVTMLTGFAVAGPLRLVLPDKSLMEMSDTGRFLMIYDEDVDKSFVFDRETGTRKLLDIESYSDITLAGNGRIVFWSTWDGDKKNVYRWFPGAGKPHVLIPDGEIPGFHISSVTTTPTGSVLGLWGYAYDPTRSPTYLYDVARATAVKVTDDSSPLALSDDGRYAAYEESARTRACPSCERAYVYDRQTRTRTLVTVMPWGSPSRTASIANLDISGDGRHVLFFSNATDLVPGFTTDRWRLYVRDLDTAETTLVSNGAFIDPRWTAEPPFPADISFDGRRVAYLKLAPTTGSWTPLEEQVFVKDAPFDSPDTRISFPGNGKTPNGSALVPQLTDDGRHVYFDSEASNLLPGVGRAAIYVRSLSPLPADGG